jgi:hypothetical protein
LKLTKLKKQIAKNYHSSKTFIQRQRYKTIYWILIDWQKIVKEKYRYLQPKEKK